jgi:hypothetical protein
MRKISNLLALLILIQLGCKDKETPVAIATAPNDILVINEGNFNLGNASLALLSQNYEVQPTVFEKANARKVGDVLQDVVKHRASIYLVVNNSGKVERLNASTFVSEAFNDKFVSPRKICFFDSTRAYVTDLYSDVLYEIDPIALKIKKEIPCSGWTEDILSYKEQVFIVNVEREKLLVFDPNLNQFVDSITLPKMPGNMLMDINNALWVYCAGETNQAAKLVKIRTIPLQIITTFELPVLKEYYPRLAMNAAKDELFILNSGVFKLNIESSQLGNRLIEGNNKSFYGLGINNQNNDILISEIVGFNAPSFIHVYDSKGNLKKSNIKSGVITSQFVN